ncbi:MAG: universal stress protein [Bacteroidetes bacterium]|nr:universal stress protein [Bacteroidota bacterium]
MKRILIATDFSPASDKALEYATRLAEALGAETTLASAFMDIPLPITAGVPVISSKTMRTFTEDQLLLQASSCKVKPSIPIHTIALEGPVSGSILALAKEIGADLIVAGVKKDGKTLRRLFGDTLTALARKTHIPLLIIPEENEHWPPNEILLGEDLEPGAPIHRLDPLLEIAGVFNSTLFSTKVIRKQSDEFIAVMNKPYGVKKLESTIDVLYEYPIDKDVVHALNHFTETHSIDMVVLLPHQHYAPERWFSKGHTWAMIFRTKIPLLVLPEPA